MARLLGPKAKLSRREGTDLFLKSARRSIADKAKFDSKPGQHGRTSGSRTSDFGLQLREKQKVKRMYGVLERQFRRYFAEAERRKGNTGSNLLLLLESRLDNVVYRLGLASTRAQARQFVVHQHILVNDKRLDRPSYEVSPGDVVAVKADAGIEALARQSTDSAGPTPAWLLADHDGLKGTVSRLPDRNDIAAPIEERLIVEHYSR